MYIESNRLICAAVLTLAGIAAPTMLLSGEEAYGQDPPNLVFILTDDQGSESISASDTTAQQIFGNEMGCFTPTLSQMSSIGVSFRNCRVNPNCSPTRAGLLTGRRSLSTGVTGVLPHYATGGDRGGDPCDPDLIFLTGILANAVDSTSLQTYERTIAEALQDAGYYTIQIDKWHVGEDHSGVGEASSEDRGASADEQGFSAVRNWKDYICLDDRDSSSDLDHMVRMADMTVDIVNNEVPANTPYAVFFHTITPHRRAKDAGAQLWWEVSDDLLFHTKDVNGFGDNNLDRFKQAVEAIDTVLRKDLLHPLGIIDNAGQPETNPFAYVPESDTVVFLLGDNGTDPLISWYNEPEQFGGGHAKNSPYEGGIRVPLIVFGEGISEPGNQLQNTIEDTLISHLDFFDTLADVAGLTLEERDNPPNDGPVLPRHGTSFANTIGYSQTGSSDENRYTLNFLGLQEPGLARAALVSDDGYKLIARAGDKLPAPLSSDEFYHLSTDGYETSNLLEEGMTQDQLNRYYEMRDMLADRWPIAVGESAYSITSLPNYSSELYQEGQDLCVLVVQVIDGLLAAPAGNDEFYNLSADPDRLVNLFPSMMNGAETSIYNDLRQEATSSWMENALGASADVVYVDIPVRGSFVASNPSGGSWGGSLLAVGHEGVGTAQQIEHRGFLKFHINAIDSLIPPGFALTDAVHAQIIIGFEQDSAAFLPNYIDFWENDAATGPIRIHKLTSSWWRAGSFDAIDRNINLGFVELPPHVVVEDIISFEEFEDFRETPMPPGTPVSFGHFTNVSDEQPNDLLDLVWDWYTGAERNFGVALVADELSNIHPLTNQQVYFKRGSGTAAIRLTLDRR